MIVPKDWLGFAFRSYLWRKVHVDYQGLSWVLVQNSPDRDIKVVDSASFDSCLVAPPLPLLDSREPRGRAVDGHGVFPF